MPWSGWWDLWGEESTAGTHGNSRVPLDIVVLGNALVAAQAGASSPVHIHRFNNFREGPLGFFWPCSHFCTVEGLVFR